MAEFIHSRVVVDQAVAADGDQTFELPVNPLSALLIHLRPLNETGTITTYTFLTGLLSALNNITVAWRGQSIVNASGQDLAALAWLWHRLAIWQSAAGDTNNEMRSLTLPILFGRRAWMPSECFPASKRGELLLTMDLDIADTGFDVLRIGVDAIELIGATPTHFQKVTTLAQTFAATGQNDINIPQGNLLRALLMFGTTEFTGAAPAPTLGEVAFLLDNRERFFSNLDFENLRGAQALFGGFPQMCWDNLHAVNAAGAGEEDTRGPMTDGGILENYAVMKFDVTEDDEYSVPTAGLGSVVLRSDADAANAVRVLPVEKVEVSTLDIGV